MQQKVAITTVLTRCFLLLCRSVPDYFWQRVLKSQLVCLASCQRTLVEILQRQMHLVEVYETMKAKLCIQPLNKPQPDHPSAPASTPASSKGSEAHSCNQGSQRKDSQRPVTWTSLLRSTPPNNTKDPTVSRLPALLLTQGKETLTRSGALNEKASSCQSSAPQPGNTSQIQHVNFQMKGKFALIQTGAEDNSRHLSQLIQRGVLPAGSTLQLLLKVIQSSSHKTYLIHT